MRPLPVVGAVTLIVFAAFAATERNPRVGAAARWEAATTGIASSSKVSVVATSVSARALALNPVDRHATIYLTDLAAPNQILALAPASPATPAANVRLAAVAGTGAAGSLGDGGAASAAQLDLSETSLLERSAIAVAVDGTVYVADTGNATIRTIAGPASTEPGVIRSAAGRWAVRQSVTLAEPMGIALDGIGNLYIADHAAGAVDVLPANGGPLETLAHVTSPASVAVTWDGATVFVASPETGAVFSVPTQTHEIKVVPGFPGSTIRGQTSPSAKIAWPSSGTCTTATDAASQQLCPAGLAVDGADHLFVSDANSGRILRIDAQTSATTVVANGLNQPGALAFDASGNLYAAEQGLNRIVAFAQVGTPQSSITLTPTPASYGNEPVGGFSAMQSLTVSNVSSSAVSGLSIPKATSPADFTVQTNSCTSMLEANSSCTLGMAFTPTTNGLLSDTLTVTDSSTSDSASAVLTGTGDDFQIQLATGQLSAVSVQAGAAGTFNLEVVPDSVFSGTVTLVCPTNLPTNTTCTFSSPTVNATAGTPAPFKVTFQTTGIVNPLTSGIRLIRNVPPKILGFPALLLIAAIAALFWLLGFVSDEFDGRWQGTSMSRVRNRRIGATFALSVAGIGVLVGCSKGNYAATVGATPPGTSTMAIAGTSQNASRALTITLNVVTK